MHRQALIDETIAIHKKTYGRAPDRIAYAPGRIEVLGNHTDYNDGTVLSAAINMGHCFCISSSDSDFVRLTAGDLLETVEFDPSSDKRMPADVQWANYVKGVMFYLKGQDVVLEGADCTFLGSIPMGAGLSSSAALEVATAYAVLAFTGKHLEKKEIGILAQAAENNFAGCNCGLLDQFSSIFGVQHGLIHSDFRTLETRPVKLPEQAQFLMINPHVKHALSDSPYNERRESCEAAAREFNDLLSHEVKALRDVSWEEFEAHHAQISPTAAQRARHVVGEITRVEQAVKLIEEGEDLAAFGELLFASHESSRINFENSCPELDMIVEAAREAGALGARLSGGGWGGSVAALVDADSAETIRDHILALCKEKDIHASAEIIIPSAGAEMLSNVLYGEDE